MAKTKKQLQIAGTAMPRDDLTVELDVERVKRATDKALLCVVDGDEVWIPRSQIVEGGKLDADAEEESAGDMLVTAWWARAKGFE